MPDTTYKVVLSLSTTGNFASGLASIGSHADVADRHIRGLGESGHRVAEIFSTVGESIGGALERAADKAIDLGVGLGKIALVSGVSAAAYGVAGLNAQLEQTEISIGAIAQAQGFTPTFAKGMEAAGDELAKMKQDIKTLPGDLGQLSAIFTTIATPAAQAKASLDDIRQLAGRTMLTSAILGVPQEVAAREMAQLLSGRAGAHNILGTRLGFVGDDAKKLNSEGPEARLKAIDQALSKYDAAADRFGTSWSAVLTTLKDNIKYTLLAPATAPLFEHVKQDIISINTYFDEHKAKVEELTHTVGARLAEGWDTIVADIKYIEPVLARLVEHIAHMDPHAAFEKLKHGAELTIGAKLAGGAISQGASALPTLMRIVGMLGGGGGGSPGLLGGGGGAGGLLSGTGAIALGTAAIGTLAIGAAGAAGAVDSLTDATAYYHDESVKTVGDLKTHVSELAATFAPATDGLHRFVDLLGVGLMQDFDLLTRALNDVGEHANTAGSWVSWLAKSMESFDDVAARAKFDNSVDTPGAIRDQTDVRDRLGFDGKDPGLGLGDMVAVGGGYNLVRLAPGERFGLAPASKVKPGAGGGGGGTTIQHLEINVSGNQDPGRVARLVMGELRRVATNPKRSSRTPRFDTAHNG